MTFSHVLDTCILDVWKYDCHVLYSTPTLDLLWLFQSKPEWYKRIIYANYPESKCKPRRLWCQSASGCGCRVLYSGQLPGYYGSIVARMLLSFCMINLQGVVMRHTGISIFSKKNWSLPKIRLNVQFGRIEKMSVSKNSLQNALKWHLQNDRHFVQPSIWRTPSSKSCIMYSLTACACYSSSGGPHASGQIWPQWRCPNVY